MCAPLYVCSTGPICLQAVARAALLSPAAQVAPAVRQLFHSSTRKQPNTGCLLEQVATHILMGLGLAVDACTKVLLGPFRPQQLLDQEAATAAAAKAAAPGSGASKAAGQQQPGGSQRAAASSSAAGSQAVEAAAASGGAAPPSAASIARQLSRQSLQQAAQVAMSGSVGQVLAVVSTIGHIVGALQAHYQRVLSPHLAAGGGSEARVCLVGLAALVKAVDERVLGALQRCLALLLSQADMTLVAEQQRGDFSPGESGPQPILDAPTPAAATVCALLGAAVEEAERHLHGPNLVSLLAEVRRVGWVCWRVGSAVVAAA